MTVLKWTILDTIGVTCAALYVEGKQSDIIDLTILVMDDKIMSIFSVGRDVSSGSRLQDLGRSVLMIFRTSSSSTTSRFDRKGAPCDCSVGCWADENY